MMKKAEDHLSVRAGGLSGAQRLGGELESRMHNRMGSRVGMTHEVSWPKPGRSRRSARPQWTLLSLTGLLRAAPHTPNEDADGKHGRKYLNKR